MSARLARAAVTLGLILAPGAVGCGSSPNPIYYAMSASPPVANGAPAPAPAGLAGWAHLIELRRPALAGYLDRAEIVSRVQDFRLRVVSGESWSEPLGDMVGRVLGEDVADRLPGSIVFSEASPISAAPDVVVSVDIQRFDVGDDGNVTLLAELAVERPPSHIAIGSRRVQLHARPGGGDTPGLVAAMSVLVGQLADEITTYLRAAPSASAGPTAAAQP